MTTTNVAALMRQHLKLVHQGKMRDSFRGPRVLLDGVKVRTRFVCVSDRVSSHDFKLGFEIAGKGEILNAITAYWKLLLAEEGVATDLIAWGRGLDRHLPKALRGNPEMGKRVTLVREIYMIPYECIVRFMLTGSAWSEYAKTRMMRQIMVYGQRLPEGMQKNDPLPAPLFTPTTKAAKGHDQPRTREEVEREYPGLGDFVLRIGELMRRDMARGKRARYADTKFEIGLDPVTGGYVLGDEVGTPDSSRIWELGDTLPNDKDYIRIAAESSFGINELNPDGTNKFDPENPAHIERVKSFDFGRHFVNAATALYHSTPTLVTGRSLAGLEQHLGMV